MTDGDGMEFRAAARLLLDAFAGTNFVDGHKTVTTVDLLARAMRIAAEEMLREISDFGAGYTADISPLACKAVAARIESRIGEK